MTEPLSKALRALLSLVRRETPHLSGKVLGDAEAALTAHQSAPLGEQAPQAEAVELQRLRKALVWVAHMGHGTPKHMLPQGVTLIDADRVRVTLDGWSVSARDDGTDPTKPPHAPSSTAGEVAGAQSTVAAGSVDVEATMKLVHNYAAACVDFEKASVQESRDRELLAEMKRAEAKLRTHLAAQGTQKAEATQAAAGGEVLSEAMRLVGLVADAEHSTATVRRVHRDNLQIFLAAALTPPSPAQSPASPLPSAQEPT